MKYILTAGWDDGIADLTARLTQELASGKQVLWLTCGGSNIPAAVQIMASIPADVSQNLRVSLSDERFGEPDHADSNWQQLMAAGFDLKQGQGLPVLQAGNSLEQAVAYYSNLVETAMQGGTVVIAQLGIGADGHIAGILPDTPASAEQSALVVGYESPPLTRLTLTFPALRKIHAAYAFAFGAPKKVALHSLQTEDLSPDILPAQILKELPEAYLYSDQVGEHI